MSRKLSGQVAVVTGASKGIGASIALHLAAEGAAVVVNYASSKEGADRVVAEIVGKGGKAIAVQANVADPADIQRLFSEAKKAFGRLDILVNNAGVYEFAPLENVTAEHFHKMFDLNVLGLILASQEAVKHFGPGGGSIINISSVAATLGSADDLGLQRDQGRRRRRDQVARPGAGTAQDPRELDQPRHGRDRRRPHRRHRRERFPQASRGADAARPDRPAAGHRAGRRLPRILGFRLDHRRNLLHRGRAPVACEPVYWPSHGSMARTLTQRDERKRHVRKTRRQGCSHHRGQQRHGPRHGPAVRRRGSPCLHHRPPPGRARRGRRSDRQERHRRPGRRLEPGRPRPALRQGEGRRKARSTSSSPMPVAASSLVWARSPRSISTRRSTSTSKGCSSPSRRRFRCFGMAARSS